MAITRTKSVTDTKDKAQKFIDRLLSEGSKVTCDETNPHFSRSFDLPEFYDEELFKKGQQFFYKHLAGMFFSKLQGLLVVLLIPTILKILIMTKMSGSTMTAYRRYIATIFHMMIWYDKDFKPGSDLWKSVAEVRKLHNSASKKGKSCSLNHISQMDMALTQFGFMGFALVRSRKVGIHNATDEEWASFIHVWRVIGHLLGIEDRFNMCGGTVDETRQISKLLIPRVYKPLIEKRDKDFLEMTYYLTDGLWCFLPILQYESLLSYNYGLLSIEDDTTEMKPLYFQLQGYAIFNFGFLKWLMEMSKYTWLRLCINFILSSRLWLSRWLPFLAFYSFGVSNSYVKLRLKDDTSPQ